MPVCVCVCWESKSDVEEEGRERVEGKTKDENVLFPHMNKYARRVLHLLSSPLYTLSFHPCPLKSFLSHPTILQILLCPLLPFVLLFLSFFFPTPHLLSFTLFSCCCLFSLSFFSDFCFLFSLFFFFFVLHRFLSPHFPFPCLLHCLGHLLFFLHSISSFTTPVTTSHYLLYLFCFLFSPSLLFLSLFSYCLIFPSSAHFLLLLHLLLMLVLSLFSSPLLSSNHYWELCWCWGLYKTPVWVDEIRAARRWEQTIRHIALNMHQMK